MLFSYTIDVLNIIQCRVPISSRKGNNPYCQPPSRHSPSPHNSNLQRVSDRRLFRGTALGTGVSMDVWYDVSQQKGKERQAHLLRKEISW